MPDLFANRAVAILVHVLEDFLQRRLLPHELAVGKTTIIVTIHTIEELRHLFPVQAGGHWNILITKMAHIVVSQPEELRTLYHSSLVSFPSPSLSALSNIFLIWKQYQ